jgi:hypothetical protein
MRLEWLAREKHSNFLDPFLSYKETEPGYKFDRNTRLSFFYL